MNKKEKGNQGELLARKFLENKSFIILETQYYTPYGEIDLIVKDVEKDTLVFVEVKYRTTKSMGTPLEAIDKRKQKKIINSANHYIVENNIDCNIRFDAIGILGEEITHIENAFLSF